MIALSNGRMINNVVASGGLAYDGKGWFWERPLVAAGLIKPEMFTVVTKTLTRYKRAGNFRWYKPRESVCLISGGAVNKIGLSNPGIVHWNRFFVPRIDFSRQIVVSIYGEREELIEMTTEVLNDLDLTAIELNLSCPNLAGGLVEEVEKVVDDVKSVRDVSLHPVIAKLSVAQDYLSIAEKIAGEVEAISLNSVPWEMVFPRQISPLFSLQSRVGGGGGVSGKPAQVHNWAAVESLAIQGCLPVIAPSVMDEEDLVAVRDLGASAVSFGVIHILNPRGPTKMVKMVS